MIAWVAPPIESRSGLAVYARDLLPFLKEKEEVRWIPLEGEIPHGTDRIIYNLGNHPANSPTLHRAWDRPDTVLLHDVNLHHAVLGLQDPCRFFETGDASIELRNHGAWLDAYESYARGLGPLLQRQRLVLVHSAYAKEVLAMHGVKTPVAVIPMGVVAPRLSADKEPLTLGLFGHIGANRQVAEIVTMIASLKMEFSALEFKAVGKQIPEALKNLDGVRILQDIPDEQYFEELARTTLFLNLRYPVMGETSLTTLQAMALGTVPVVYDLGSYAELPGDAAVKVPIQDDLAKILAGLLMDPKRRISMERAGWIYAKENHSPQRWAGKIWEALCGSPS